jgi:hypothetical protein
VILSLRAVVAQEAATFEVPKGIVRQLSGSVVDLNGDKQPEVVVSGKYGVGGICGSANCPRWVFRETPVTARVRC